MKSSGRCAKIPRRKNILLFGDRDQFAIVISGASEKSLLSLIRIGIYGRRFLPPVEMTNQFKPPQFLNPLTRPTPEGTSEAKGAG
jgi:hypothetical protein